MMHDKRLWRSKVILVQNDSCFKYLNHYCYRREVKQFQARLQQLIFLRKFPFVNKIKIILETLAKKGEVSPY